MEVRTRVLAGTLIVWLAPLLAGAEGCLLNRITVEGQAEVRIRPDQVRIVMLAEQRAPNQAQAEAPVSAATEAVVSLARGQGIAEADIDTSDYSVRPIYQWNSGKKLGKRLGYQARRNVIVTLRDVSRFTALIDAITESGGVAVTGIEPDSEKTRTHRDAARVQAVRAAREKAQAVADELKQSVGRAITIEVDGATSCCGGGGERTYSGANYRNLVVPEDGTEGPNLGDITLTARVKVAFELK